MTRRRTFAFRGYIVSVVPDSQIRPIRDREEAERITQSAEREGGAALLFDILGKWAPGHRVLRSELRKLVADEVEKYSLLHRRPLREAVAYRLPEPVDLRDLVEPAPLGSNTTEPPHPGVGDPEPWIEVEVVDSHGRTVPHFTCNLRSNTDASTFDLDESGAHRQALNSTAAVTLQLTANPDKRGTA